MIEDQQEGVLSVEYVYIFLIAIVFVWKKKRNFQFKRRMTRSRKMSPTEMDDQKIIVAIEIQNLFLKYSNKKQLGYLKLEIQSHQPIIIKKLKNLFGYGQYYCLLQQQSKMKAFLKGLSSIENVQLYLYTSLHRPFAQGILKKLGVQSYFLEENRRYCQEQERILNRKKNPSWVNTNTRRVMIVTPNRDDYDEQDRKYFLVINKLKKTKILKSVLQLVRHLMEKVDSVDNLHAEMEEVKAQIQSDYENQQTVTE